MSVYNGEKYLTESINSVLNQSFQEYEFIIVNDGSTDGSYDIAKKIISLKKFVQLISFEKNYGQQFKKLLKSQSHQHLFMLKMT